ncbi:MAG: HU family DNA-binding protein [Nocardioides marinisabuli]|nr:MULTISPECIES: HU family DNA-binding protein [Nocardioides]
MKENCMNKGELRETVAKETGLTGADAERAVDAALSAIVSAVAKGERVSIAGFGTFEPRERSAREGRNPQTGETMQIAATTVPGFKAAAAFKKAVAG